MKYTRIDIKSEADLPEKSGYYVTWSKNDMSHMETKWFINHRKNEWDDVISYLIEDTEPSYPEKPLSALANAGIIIGAKAMRDGKITIKKFIDDCIHFDECQGRNKCTCTEIESNKCIGTNCGCFEKSTIRDK